MSLKLIIIYDNRIKTWSQNKFSNKPKNKYWRIGNFAKLSLVNHSRFIYIPEELIFCEMVDNITKAMASLDVPNNKGR